MRYNGQVLPWDDTDGWRRVLGPASREAEGILTWDETGIILYDNDPQVAGPEAFEVLLGRARFSPETKKEPDHWPHKTFTNRLSVDGAAVTVRSTHSEINLRKQGTSFGVGRRPGIYKYSTGQFDVWLEYGHDKSLTIFSMTKWLRDAKQDDQ